MYDEKKTEELLANIDGGIEIKDISKLLCKKIIGVRLNGKRGKMSTTIDIKSLGLSNYDEIDTFVSSNMKNTVMNFFHKDVIKGFDNLINKVRQTMYRYSSTNDGAIYYMTEGNYLKFQERFTKVHLEEFNTLKENLIKSLPTYKKQFEDDLKVFVNSRGLAASEAKILYSSILSRFPTKELIESSCSLNYYVIPFPVYNKENLEGLNEEIVSKLDADKDATAIETFYDMVGGSLKETFDLIYKCMSFVDDNTSMGGMSMSFEVPSKTKGHLNNSILKLVEDNKVLKNETLKKVIAVVSRTFRERKNVEGLPVTNSEAIDISEQLLGILYSYSVYLGIEDKFAESVLLSEYTEEDLMTIGEVADIDKI